MSASGKPKLGGWWVAVVLLGFVGGGIGWFALRGEDRLRARRVFKFGLLFSVISIALPILALVAVGVAVGGDGGSASSADGTAADFCEELSDLSGSDKTSYIEAPFFGSLAFGPIIDTEMSRNTHSVVGIETIVMVASRLGEVAPIEIAPDLARVQTAWDDALGSAENSRGPTFIVSPRIFEMAEFGSIDSYAAGACGTEVFGRAVLL